MVTKTVICTKCKGIIMQDINSKYKKDFEVPGKHELDCSDYWKNEPDKVNPYGI